jgi:signal transduction histidine kinase
MKALDVLNSLTFRYIVKYVTVLSATVFLLLAALYAYISYSLFSDLSGSILEELETLQVVYSGQGLVGVEQYVEDQIAAPASGRFYYLVTDDAGSPLAGNLGAVPRYEQFTGGWLGFQLALLEWGETVDVDFLARPAALGDGYEAIVARNYADIVDQAGLVFRTLFRAMLATILLGVIGGFFSAASTLDRVERLNRELSAIIRSSPDKRIDVNRQKGYVRQLAMIMNSLLEQTESLMQGVKTVSDNIAHDLRTPLTRMRNQLVQLRDRSAPQHGEELDAIIADCDDILATFNALLRISSLESGGHYGGEGRVQLNELLADVVELYEPLATEREIALEYKQDDSAIIPGDRDLLFQLFANLVDNALKYTPRGGRAALILAGRHDGFQRVQVENDGPGIPADERSNVLRRFYRLEFSRGAEPGHGLGLSLVQAIVHYHRGRLALEDANPGLRVSVELPAA